MQKKLYELFYAEMMKVCYRYTKDADKAGTVYNDAMLKVFKNIDRYTEEGKFAGWIKTIVVNTAIDFLKVKSNFSREEVSKDSYLEDHQIENAVIEKIENQQIQKLINSIPEKEAVVFNLYVYEEYNHDEIGILLNISASTSRYFLAEARKALREKVTNLIPSLNKDMQP